MNIGYQLCTLLFKIEENERQESPILSSLKIQLGKHSVSTPGNKPLWFDVFPSGPMAVSTWPAARLSESFFFTGSTMCLQLMTFISAFLACRILAIDSGVMELTIKHYIVFLDFVMLMVLVNVCSLIICCDFFSQSKFSPLSNFVFY